MKVNQYDDELVSVIIPVYNAEKYVAKTIESVLSQTYKKVEIILVDDCSIDNSVSILVNYKERYENISYCVLEENSGVAVARNSAISMAKGRYVALLDSDDIWYSNKLEKQIELMKEKEAAFSFTAIEMIDGYDNLLKSKRDVKEKINYIGLLKNTMIATSTVVIDRWHVKEFKMKSGRIGEDYATWLMILRNGLNAYGINEALVKYRKTNDSLSAKKFKNFGVVWNVYTKEENIHPLIATYYSLCYALNAFKKHLL